MNMIILSDSIKAVLQYYVKRFPKAILGSRISCIMISYIHPCVFIIINVLGVRHVSNNMVRCKPS